jgi:ADP-ribosylation factor related protein 1
MFGLVHGLYVHYTAKLELNILILGLDNAGKTTMLEQLKGIYKKMPGIRPDRIPPTIGLNIGKMDVAGCKCLFWDVGGQQKLRSLWDRYYAEAHGMVFVLDANDPDRLDEALRTFEAVRESEELRGIPILIIANKQDLPAAMSADELRRKFGGVRVQPASCLTCEGLDEGVRWIVQEARTTARSLD